MTTLQQQARALGDPTRHAIFRYVADAGAPVGVAEMTDHFGLNHNAIRQHLAKLVDAELLVGTTAAPTGRGRPRLEFSVAPAAESQWGVTGPYERLSVLLTEIIRTGDTAYQVGKRAGREHDVDGPSVDKIATAMAREGFAPEVRPHDEGVEIVLHNCPFKSAVLTDPDTVCALHLGLAEGIAEGTDAVVDELVRHDPRVAGCNLRLHVGDPRAGGATPDAGEPPTDGEALDVDAPAVR